ncbi:MAG TPA: hypothetical protein VM434_02830, partial [Beijerinckiaceae bacterium]|nr:hypothetical protein [Beijerinckiaceae bacterium]
MAAPLPRLRREALRTGAGQELGSPEKRDEGHPFRREQGGRAFLPVHDGGDEDHLRAVLPQGADGLHRRFAGCGDVLDHGDAAAGEGLAPGEALDELLRPVFLRLLAHEDAPHRAADGVAAQAHGPGDRDRPHLEPADILGAGFGDRRQEAVGHQARPFRIEHRRLHVEIEV